MLPGWGRGRGSIDCRGQKKKREKLTTRMKDIVGLESIGSKRRAIESCVCSL